MSGYPPEVPGVTQTGVQRALGERRRRRMAERGGHVDLDATMSSWPTPDPPSRPRPVVRPRRSMPGAAEGPVLPPPAALAMLDLAEHAPAPPPMANDIAAGSRRARRGDTGTMPPVRPSGDSSAVALAPRGPAARTAVQVNAPPLPQEPVRRPLPQEPVHRTPPQGPVHRTPPQGPVHRPLPPQVPAPPMSPAETDPFARGEAADRQPFTRVPPPERPSVPRARRGAEPDVSRPKPEPRVNAPTATRRAAATEVEGRPPPFQAASSELGPTTPFGAPGQVRAESAAPAATRARRGGATQAVPDEPSRKPFWRRRDVLIGLAILVSAAVVAVAVFMLRSQPQVSGALLPPSDAPRQDTALVSVLGDDGTIAQSALLALDDNALTSLAVPGDLLMTVSDAGEVTLGGSVKIDAGAPDRGIEDTLGVRVDGSWVLDRAALADLVDASGGVVLDVAAQITAGDVTIPAGPAQRLTGTQAGVYALAAVEGETPDVAVARFNQVILGLLAVMPTDSERVTQLISATERNTATTITSELLTRIIAGSSQRIAADRATPETVPIAAPGAGETSVILDIAGMAQMVAGELAGAQLPVSTVGPLRVSVQNADGTDGLVTTARDRLVAGGFRYAGGGEAQDLGAVTSVVLVPTDTPENRARGQAVASALGLGADSLAVLPPEQSAADLDIIVVLGRDFADLESGQGT